MAGAEHTAVVVTYTNYRGETAERRIMPTGKSLHYGSTEWHPKPQWLLEAYDCDKKENRVFAMEGFSKWHCAN
jgi:hypothetical protein